MFDIGWGELLVIGVVALIAIGPKELPGVLRAAGQWLGKIRRMASEFQGQFQEAMREAEMADLQKQVNDIGDAAHNLTSNFDPLEYAGVKDILSDPKPAETATATEPSVTPQTADSAPVSTPAAAGQTSAAPVEANPVTPVAEAGGGRAA